MNELEELVRRAQQGDRAAFGTLWEDHLKPVAIRAVVDSGIRRADIDDALSEVALQVLRKLQDLKAPKAAKAWVRRVARNLALRMSRPRGRRVVHYGFDDDEAAARAEPGVGKARAEAVALIQLWIRARLPMPTRLVCTRILLDGASRTAVAHEAGLTIARVDYHLVVGIERVQAWAREELDGNSALQDLL